ncbi:MAG: cupredoxin domain-containing protein, partial [Armatimonadetes bacterium]|nr:cupredoxin domain-containing protein [Armatimonadota bacterium]
MRTRMWWVAVALAAAIAAGCGGRPAQQPAQPTQPAAGAPITVVGKDNVYEPTTVEIKAGTEHEIVFVNKGETVHNLIVEAKDAVGQDFSTDMVVNAGQESKFKVKIDKPGTYKMQCTYHSEMVGDLKV